MPYTYKKIEKKRERERELKVNATQWLVRQSDGISLMMRVLQMQSNTISVSGCAPEVKEAAKESNKVEVKIEFAWQTT